MKVEIYSSRHANSWNAFLKQANNASFLFHRDFMEYHKDRFCDHSLLIYDTDKLIALVPAHIQDQVLCSHFGLSYGGIIHTSALTLSHFLSILEAIADHCKKQNIAALILNEIPAIYQTISNNHLPFVSYALQASIQNIQLLSTVNFSAPLTLNTNRKRMVQKGMRQGYFIQEDQSATSFWQEILIPRLQERYQTNPVHSLEEITTLMRAFPQAIKQFNVYNAQGELVGGTMLFIHPHVVHLQYIAGKEQDNAQGALDLLIYTLLEHYKTSVRYFDFGSSQISPKQVNSGLLYWKESFGARSIPQYCYVFNMDNLSKARGIIDG